MLVLSRKVGESVLIGDDIVVTIVEARGDAVRIGIEAPRSMRVHRSEVATAVSEANAAAAAVSDDDVKDLLGRLRRPE
ncbi:carbon storage regulator CsrA [Sanguibacter massiliensis]|uniref:carbon storage regulator CsrA n=1 Tax=Sanguibacter massiliensis TaxID=1973217 RepID=UPI000C830167|nr:carbon storage regulator CsrA [Sanguibacter massiliensis]